MHGSPAIMSALSAVDASHKPWTIERPGGPKRAAVTGAAPSQSRNAQRSDQAGRLRPMWRGHAVSSLAGDWPSVIKGHNSAGDRSMNM